MENKAIFFIRFKTLMERKETFEVALMAKTIGISERRLLSCMQGKIYPRETILKAITKYLRVDRDWLTGNSKEDQEMSLTIV